MHISAVGKRDAILRAAEIQFSQYGFRRTSMDDIAKQTGISRASLYSYFDNKEEIFRSLAESMYDESLTNAEREIIGGRGAKAIETRLYDGLYAYFAHFYRTLESTPHGTEIMDESSRLNGDIAASHAEKLEALLAAELRFAAKAGEIDLKRMGFSPASAAEIIRLSCLGLKHGSPDLSAFKKKLVRFLPAFLAGLNPAAPV